MRGHGRDTLAAFKLRNDLEYLFSPDGRAFVGYRVEQACSSSRVTRSARRARLQP